MATCSENALVNIMTTVHRSRTPRYHYIGIVHLGYPLGANVHASVNGECSVSVRDSNPVYSGREVGKSNR